MSNSKSSEKIILVNEHDEVIGSCLRSEKPRDAISRASAVWIESSQGDILLAQRAWHKKVKPGQWGAAAAGAVELGENYLENALKEIQEEIGYTLDPSQIIDSKKFYISESIADYFAVIHRAVVDDIDLSELVLEDAVADIKWFSRKEIQEYFNNRNESDEITFDHNLKKILDWTHQLRKDGVV